MQSKLQMLWPRTWSCHVERTSDELVQIDGLGRECDARRRTLRETLQNSHRIVRSGFRGVDCVTLDWIQALGVDLLEIADSSSHVVPKVVDHAFHCTTVE